MCNDGLDFNEVIDRIHNMLCDDGIVSQNGRYKNVILASWASYFDAPFLRAQYDKIGRAWPFGNKSFDFKSIAIWEMAKRNIVIVEGLSAYSSKLGLDFDGTPHDALSDIKSAREILKKLASEA
jgi:inhibitor of KinA sporulation pathway (predicted exonuclease)